MNFIKLKNLRLSVFALILFVPFFAAAKSHDNDRIALDTTKNLIGEIVEKSFPELDLSDLKVKTFQSPDTFFKSQFSLARFLTFRKLQVIIFVNPKVYELNAPTAGIRAILAHELSHAVYYKSKNRLQLLGLVNLISTDFNVKFERKTDLTAIERGYGAGLIEYRKWLYQNIPANQIAGKKRNYFTPEEIKILNAALEKNPEIIKKLRKTVPRNLTEVIKVTN